MIDNQIKEIPLCEKCKKNKSLVMIGKHLICGRCAQVFSDKQSKYITGVIFDGE